MKQWNEMNKKEKEDIFEIIEVLSEMLGVLLSSISEMIDDLMPILLEISKIEKP